MSAIFIIGASGHGKVAADTAQACGYDRIAFLDDAWPEKTVNGPWPVIGRPQDGRAPLFCAIGDNRTRARFFRALGLDQSPVLAHPGAVVSGHARVGGGTLVVAGSVVNAGASVGRGVILNTGSSVDHDCDVADFVHLSPGARLAGNVRVGMHSWIGMGAMVREGVRIGQDVTVAAGAVVLSDVDDGGRVAGVPARRMT